MVTTASEWRERRKKGIELQLPQYGDVVAIRPMDVQFFVQSGRIPDYLSATVQKLIKGEAARVATPDEEQQKTEEWMTWLNDLMKWAFISPKVVDNPQGEDEIAVDEIEYADKLFIYRQFGQPAELLRSFRKRQVELMASLDAPKANGTAPQPSNGHSTLVEQAPGDAR